MRKLVIPIVLLLVAFFIFRALTKEPEKIRPAKPEPISVGKQSAEFMASFTTLLNSYYQLKDAFVAGKLPDVDKMNALVKTAADSLKIDEIQGDTAGTIRETARYFGGTIGTTSGTLAAAKDLESKRKEFDALTDALWNLTRTVRFNGEKIYYQYCPMAFDNKGAYWLSNQKAIRNPYFGSKMLTCGETADSVDYSN
jgi:Cu(I)/Ag(I) efflux system membrane fusion protein